MRACAPGRLALGKPFSLQGGGSGGRTGSRRHSSRWRPRPAMAGPRALRDHSDYHLPEGGAQFLYQGSLDNARDPALGSSAIAQVVA